MTTGGRADPPAALMLLIKYLHIFFNLSNTIIKTMEVTMKITNKNGQINTIPDGIWESSPPEEDYEPNKNDITTDLQGNGYPLNEEKQKNKNSGNP